MNDLAHVLDSLVAAAPVERASWDDVQARLRPRRRRRFAAAAVAVAMLATAGTAVALEAARDRVREQERSHDTAPDHPKRVGNAVEIVSGDGWTLIAWRRAGGAICVDFVVVPGKSPFGCDWPVRGAKAPDDTGGTGPPTHAVSGFLSGAGLVGPDGKPIRIATIFGVAAADVAAVRVELGDGRVAETAIYDAPGELRADLRFFIVRLHLPPTPLAGDAPVTAFLAYDDEGRLIERVAL